MNSDSDQEDYVPYVSARERKQREMNSLLTRLGTKNPALLRAGGPMAYSTMSRYEDKDQAADEDGTSAAVNSPKLDAKPAAGPTAGISLMDQAQQMHRPQTESEKLKQEEAKLLQAVGPSKQLKSAYELAQDIQYSEPLTTSWTPPKHAREWSEDYVRRLRKKLMVLVEGEDAPPPLPTFKEMRLPPAILDYLKGQKILKPTAVQALGLPVAFSGRDMIAIAHTGSGKTLAFILPIVMRALEVELDDRTSLRSNEGPIGLILCPSRELAKQTQEIAERVAEYMYRAGFPRINTMLCIGGIDMREQYQQLRSRGTHVMVATPGRLQHLLDSKRIHFDRCHYLCMDEADRMVDMGFEDDIRTILGFFKHQRQTLLFSATMPLKIREFAASALVKPVTVNVGRAGSANLNVLQQVEYVPKENRILHLLNVLQKTAPPVLIFAENKSDVDDIQEYLLIKGVEAVAVHGSKEQEEREYAIRMFRENKRDVLVATDVASKGLDFKDIQHVILYDMPREIEDYVHRIGRTGRGGKKGIATTFIDQDCSEQVLLDLKHVLIEAKQPVPPFLQQLGSDQPAHGGCAYCGGMGHRIMECPKFHLQKAKQLGQTRNFDRDQY